jgi:hypothetical protein
MITLACGLSLSIKVTENQLADINLEEIEKVSHVLIYKDYSKVLQR